MNLFAGLETSKRSILARQAALQTIQHNLANASTPGYSRQRVELKTTEPYHAPTRMNNSASGQFGSGVEVTGVSRVRNAVLDHNIREQLEVLGNFEKQHAFFAEVQRVFGDPTDHHLRNAIDEFWASLQRLSTNPENHAIRAELIQVGENLAERFQGLYRDLHKLRHDADREIEAIVSNVNGLVQRIADTTGQIMRIQAAGRNPNDLLDERDLLLDELSRIVDIEVITYGKNRFSLSIGGVTLVQDDKARALSLSTNANGFFDILDPNGQLLDIRDGELEGLIVSRDQNIPAFIDKVNDLAASMIAGLNGVHQAGYGLDNTTGIDLFLGTDASDMEFNPLLSANPSMIAASTLIDTAGNGDNALAMADLFKTPMIDDTTWNNYYEMLIADLGVVAQRAGSAVESQRHIVHSVEQARLSVSGVSIDEEMVEAIQYQHGYNASAQMVRVYDEMLDTIIRLKA